MTIEKKILAIKKKAEKGLTFAQIELGYSYLNGENYQGEKFPQDTAEAIKWLEMAHQKGSHTATTILGTIYEKGNGVLKNTDRALELYESAASQGSFLSSLYLARIYANDAEYSSIENATIWYRRVISLSDESDQEAVSEAKQFLAKL